MRDDCFCQRLPRDTAGVAAVECSERRGHAALGEVPAGERDRRWKHVELAERGNHRVVDDGHELGGRTRECGDLRGGFAAHARIGVAKQRGELAGAASLGARDRE